MLEMVRKEMGQGPQGPGLGRQRHLWRDPRGVRETSERRKAETMAESRELAVKKGRRQKLWFLG